MGKVVFVTSMSLDGFMTGANVGPDAPLGEGGERLHEWVFNSQDERNRQILIQGVKSIGAVIAGRRTYDLAIEGWGADGPTGPARVPVFVVSHHAPQEVPADGVYTFVDGIEAALAGAKARAGDKDVSVMGGADVGQQMIRAGLIDEFQIQLIPVLFGSGTRMFEHLGSRHIELETREVIETPEAIHLRFRLVK